MKKFIWLALVLLAIFPTACGGGGGGSTEPEGPDISGVYPVRTVGGISLSSPVVIELVFDNPVSLVSMNITLKNDGDSRISGGWSSSGTVRSNIQGLPSEDFQHAQSGSWTLSGSSISFTENDRGRTYNGMVNIDGRCVTVNQYQFVARGQAFSVEACK